MSRAHEPLTKTGAAGVYAITCSCYQWSSAGVGRTDLWDLYSEHVAQATGLVSAGQGGLW